MKKVTFVLITAMAVSFGSCNMSKMALESAYKQDKNNDGYLSLEEFTAFQGGTSEEELSMAKEAFERADTNKDGKLSKQELTAFFR